METQGSPKVPEEAEEAAAARAYSPDGALDWDACPVKEIHRLEARMTLQAAIEQVGGGQG